MDRTIIRRSNNSFRDIDTSDDRILLRNDISLPEILNISFEKINQLGFTPIITIENLHKILLMNDTKTRNKILEKLTSKRRLIKTAGIIRDIKGVIVDPYIRYFKFLKGMRVYLKINIFLDKVNQGKFQISNNTNQSMISNSFKNISDRLSKDFGIRFDPIRTVVLKKTNIKDSKNILGRLDITDNNYEDFLFFYYSWYMTEEFSNVGDIFNIRSIQRDFEFNYNNVNKIISKYFNILDLFLDNSKNRVDSKTKTQRRIIIPPKPKKEITQFQVIRRARGV